MEEKFVKMFILKQYQDRLLFELNSKKREKAIDRFSHNAKNVLKENLILMQGANIKIEDVKKVLNIHKNSKEVYLISLNSLYAINNILNIYLMKGVGSLLLSWQPLLVLNTGRRKYDVQINYNFKI